MIPGLLLPDTRLTPHDVLSEAVYTSVKLDAISDANSGANETTMESMEVDVNVNEKSNSDIDSKSKSAEKYQYSLRKVLAGAHLGWVRSLAVDEVTNEWFVSGLADGLIKVWDLASGGVKASVSGHIMGVRALAISNRYSYLFSGSEDKTVRCWDLERTSLPAGCQIRNYHGHVGGIYAMALHPELDLLFTAGRDSAIRVWDIRTKNQVMVLPGHRSDVTSLVAQIGDPQICSSSMDSTVRLWDIRKETTQVTLTHHRKSVRLLIMHPAEMTMASADSAGTINQWVLPRGQLLNSFGETDLEADANIITTMSLNPESNVLFTGFSDGRMKFYNYISGSKVFGCTTVPSPGSDTSSIYASVFDMLGTRLITGESDKSIKIWGVE